MVFTSPSWVPGFDINSVPDDVPICDLILTEKHGRCPLAKSRNPFTCGLSGKTYSYAEVQERVDCVARALAEEMGWTPNGGTEWDKVAGIFSLNTIDYNSLCWAIHRLGGIASPANAAYMVDEIAYQMKDSGAKCIWTCLPLLQTALEAAAKLGIPKNKIFLLDMAKEFTGSATVPKGFKTFEDFMQKGKKLRKLDALKWSKGESKRRVAFLCYSSGTSGPPKGVMISHYNVMANTLQVRAFDQPSRDQWRSSPDEEYNENCLGLLPMSHIYGLVVICHASVYRGDCVIVLPKFELKQCLQCIQDYKIAELYLVPPIIILFTNNGQLLKQYDFSHVKTIFTGAAPLGEETAEEIGRLYPDIAIRQAYGLTETCTVVCSSYVKDIWSGSCGSVLVGQQVRLVTPDGEEVTEYGKEGEVWVKGPSIALGYLNNPKATQETFTDGWVHTGDIGVVKKNPKSGHEHVFIVDRIKELIKVRGLQVAPAELEAHLLTHHAVSDCAVISIPDASSGERAKAYVVKSNSVGLEEPAAMVKRDIMKHVEKSKSRHKWLKEVEFIDAIPKSPSGKILRRHLRDRDREERRKKGAKM